MQYVNCVRKYRKDMSLAEAEDAYDDDLRDGIEQGIARERANTEHERQRADMAIARAEELEKELQELRKAK